MITYAHVTETKPHQFRTEASTIGLAPGEWPALINTEIGNRQPLYRKSALKRDGEIIYVVYTQAMGCIDVIVLND